MTALVLGLVAFKSESSSRRRDRRSEIWHIRARSAEAVTVVTTRVPRGGAGLLIRNDGNLPAVDLVLEWTGTSGRGENADMPYLAPGTDWQVSVVDEALLAGALDGVLPAEDFALRFSSGGIQWRLDSSRALNRFVNGDWMTEEEWLDVTPPRHRILRPLDNPRATRRMVLNRRRDLGK